LTRSKEQGSLVLAIFEVYVSESEVMQECVQGIFIVFYQCGQALIMLHASVSSRLLHIPLSTAL
jgi:hypothetical protein